MGKVAFVRLESRAAGFVLSKDVIAVAVGNIVEGNHRYLNRGEANAPPVGGNLERLGEGIMPKQRPMRVCNVIEGPRSVCTGKVAARIRVVIDGLQWKVVAVRPSAARRKWWRAWRWWQWRRLHRRVRRWTRLRFGWNWWGWKRFAWRGRRRIRWPWKAADFTPKTGDKLRTLDRPRLWVIVAPWLALYHAAVVVGAATSSWAPRRGFTGGAANVH